MVYSYRSAMARIAVLCGLSAVQLVASSWPEEFVQRYEAHGLALLHTNEADWVQRTNEYGLRRPTHACQIFVYRAFDLWSQMGAMYRATVSVTQFMIPDEILWRIAVYWPDLGNHWHEASWRLHPVDDSRSASCLPDLIQPTYVLVMPGLLNEMAHRPHGLLEVTQGDICHVRATVLPPRINLPILLEFLKAFCRRGWPQVRCVGTHNRVPLTDELQDCQHGFFVQITITRAIPTHAVDVTRWCSEAGQLMHLDYQYYAGDSHQFWVGIAHGLTLLASSLAPCWGDRESWDEWLLMELRHRYLALCGLAVHLHAVHSSIGDLDACYDPGRTYMVAAPERPPCSLEEAVAVLYVRVRVEGFYDEGAVWCPAAIACGAMIEQLGLFVACAINRDLAGATSMGILCTMIRLRSHMVTSLPFSRVIRPTGCCQDMLHFLLPLVVGREDTMERFPSAAQSNVLRPQVGAVQMLHIQSTRTNRDGGFLPWQKTGRVCLGHGLARLLL